jgi:hypothetical protein
MRNQFNSRGSDFRGYDFVNHNQCKLLGFRRGLIFEG